jgi:hypothetical protein
MNIKNVEYIEKSINPLSFKIYYRLHLLCNLYIQHDINILAVNIYKKCKSENNLS